MAELDLGQFCEQDPTGWTYLLKPFSRGEFTYATNGHILVRVARRDDVPDVEGAPGCDKIMEAIADQPASGFTVPDLPEPPVSREIECGDCEGTGRERYERSDRWHDCDSCGGTGKDTVVDTQSICLRGVIFDVEYVRLLSTLPGLKISENPLSGDPLRIEFDGGIGVLMPMRRPGDKHFGPKPTQDPR